MTRNLVLHFLARLDGIEDLLVSWMIPEWIEIRVVFDPAVLQLVAGARKQTVQQIERRLDVAQLRIDTGHIVLCQDIIWVHGQRS